MTSWKFAEPDYVVTNPNNTLTLCASDPTSTSIVLNAQDVNTQSVKLSEMTFGWYVQSANSFNQEPINTFGDQYGIYADSVVFSTGIRGIGLPPESFARFSNLLNIVVKGNATCNATEGGICFLPGQCSDYTLLWDYMFGVTFDLEPASLRFSIASIASDALINDIQPVCNIYA